MNAPIVKRTKTGAWLTSYGGVMPADLHKLDGDDLIDRLAYSSQDMTDQGWVRVGEADITVTLASVEARTADTIAALRRKQGELQSAATRIEGEIQKLLSITCDEVTA